MTAEAPFLPCRGCGAPLAISPTADAATCPRCKATTPVPSELRRRARVYESSLGAERRKVELARGFGKSPLDAAGKYFGPPFAVLLVGFFIANMALDKDDEPYAMYGFIGGMALLGAAFFLWLKLAMKREAESVERPEPLPAAIFEGSVTGTCSTCGGRVPFAVEQHSARCPYCSATVFPTKHDQSALLAMAGETADFEAARATRKLTRELARSRDGGGIASASSWLRWLPFMMAPLIVACVGGSLAFADGPPDLANLGGGGDIIGLAMLAGGILVLGLLLVVALLTRRGGRNHPIARAVGDVASTFGGKMGAGIFPLLDWLDANWAATVESEALAFGANEQGVLIVRCSVAFTFMGRPAMLVVADAPHLRRTDLFLSSYRRRAGETWASAAAAHEIRGDGFTPVSCSAGVHVGRSDNDPRAIAPQRVKWILERAAKLAQA